MRSSLVKESSQCPTPHQHHQLALSSQKSPPTELQSPCLENGSNIITPAGRKDYWLTPSLEPLSSSQIYDSLRNSATGKLCGSFWIHLGKDDIHGEVCDFFFKKFQAAFEMASFIPCNVVDYHATVMPHHGFKRKLPVACVWSLEDPLKWLLCSFMWVG